MAASHQPKASGTEKGKRIRSFRGCTTCRSRRVKCDERHPECLKCSQAGLTCGYENSLFFDSDEVQYGSHARFRRPLLSLQERESMSRQITASVPPKLAIWNLEQIDDHCESADRLSSIEIRRGPFSAFRVTCNGAVTPVEDSSVASVRADQEAKGTEHALEDLAFAQPEAWSPHTEEALNILFDDFDPGSVEAMWNLPPTADRILEIADGMSFSGLSNTSWSARAPTTLQSPVENFTISRSITPVQCAQIDIPQSAWVLLKHYLNSVLKSLTPFRQSTKTPWHILFVPLVKASLAGLALQEDVDEASLCVFYGTLAISASSLGGTSQASTWERKGEIYRQRAYEHATASVATAYGATKTAKYKSQLMAMLTMAQMSILSGEREQTERFLLEAEKLIRVRGLNRKKSRKVRLLHHCYAYERIFFESTSSGGPVTVQNHRHLRKALEMSGAGSYSKDSIGFRLPSIDNLEADMLRVKDQDMGENDLHLQMPGMWPSSQYSEIFGLPESYIFLVSLIVRLARERDGEVDDDIPSTLSMKDFTNRSKAIERLIKQQRPLSHAADTDVENLMSATHHAVTIYFYRRIHDVDACMLQQQVSDVRDSLLRHESSNPEKGLASTRLVWPAFVAACEAETPAIQSFFAKWFETASQQSGFRLFDVTMSNIEKVWAEKRRGS